MKKNYKKTYFVMTYIRFSEIYHYYSTRTGVLTVSLSELVTSKIL